MGDFRELKVWQKAQALAVDVTEAADAARKRNRGNLRTQSIRAAMSIPANIAEGKSGRSDEDQIRFLRIAVGSCYELESHLLLADKLQFLHKADVERLTSQLVEVRKMLFGLISYLDRSSSA